MNTIWTIKFNPFNFYFKEDLKSMEITDKISMFDIYAKLEEKNPFSKGNDFFPDDKNINIVKSDNDYFDIYYTNIILLSAYEKPIKVGFKDKKIDIINSYHLSQIIRNFNFRHPNIICEKCETFEEVSFNNLIKHKNPKKHNIYIKEIDNFKRIEENKFNSFFNREKKGKELLGFKFNNPELFEKNFKYYFKDYEEIYKNRPFILYNNKNRKKFFRDLDDNFSLSIRNFYALFGQSGLGKSISIITFIKYYINHNYIGTIYLNMKTINNLIKDKKFDLIKQILIDEIPYLFFNRYNKYLLCADLISGSNYNNIDSFWDLISEIINFIHQIPDDQRLYIFLFDQYNDKIDGNEKLIDIFQKYKYNQNNRLGIITLSSMNNNDIKEYRKDYLCKNLDPLYKSQLTFTKNLKELDNIFDIYSLTLEDDTYKEYFQSLGSNIKYYNRLKNCIDNNKSVDNEIDQIKASIEEKFKLYYNCKSDKKNIIRLLYFSVEKKYDLNTFLDIVEYVPFKYFTTRFVDQKKYIKIDYAFPLVEEVVNGLLENLFHFELNIYDILCNNNLIDGGERGQMFEKLITFHLNPKAYKPFNKKFFKDITITDIIKMRKFIPRIDETIIERKVKKRLEKGVYLFTQKILNGKALDILIVTIDDKNNAQIISFQITIHKPDNEIFTKDKLQKTFTILHENLNKIYDFQINEKEILFTYIFDITYKDKNKQAFENMINKCSKENMPYILFDHVNSQFYNNKNKKINTLYDNVSSAYDYTSSKNRQISGGSNDDLLDDDLSFLIHSATFNENCGVKSEEIKDAIEVIKKNEDSKYKNINLKYNNTLKYFSINDLDKKNVYFGRTFLEARLFIIYFSEKENKFISNYVYQKPAGPDRMNLYILDEYSIL